MTTTASIRFADKSQRILVTGGTGFIGQLLVRALVDDGHQVWVLSRTPARAHAIFQGKAKIIGSMQGLSDSFQLDAIINLAGARILGLPWSVKQKARLKESRVGLTDTLIQWIAKAQHKPKVLLSASAIGYYGIQPQGDTTSLTEASPAQAIFMSQLCQAWEASAQAAQEYGVKVATLRFGLVLGHGGALPMMLLPIKLGLGGKLGTGQQWVSWIHVEDVLRGIAHVWHEVLNNSHASSTYNFTAPDAVTQAHFTQIAAKVLMRPAFIPTPAVLIKTLLGEQADLLLEGQRIVPSALVNSGFTFNYPTLTSALTALQH